MKLPCRAQVDRGPAGEPARRWHGPPRARLIARMAFDDEGRITAAFIDHVQDVGAYPTPWPVGTAAAVGMLFPGPYRVPSAGFRTTSVFSNTSDEPRTEGPGSSSHWRARCCSTSQARRMGIDPVELRRRNLLRAGRAAVREPERHALRRHHAHRARSSRRWRCSTTAPFAASRPRPVRKGGISAWARARTSSRRRARMAFYGTEGATIRVEPTGKVNVYVAGGSAGNSLETAVVQLDSRRARRRHRRRAHRPGRHRGDPLRRRHRRQP